MASLGAEPLLEAALLEAPRFPLVAQRLVDRSWRERVDTASGATLNHFPCWRARRRGPIGITQHWERS